MLVHANILNSEIEPFIAVTRDNFEHDDDNHRGNDDTDAV